MGWSWKPETKEEKEEYRRIRLAWSNGEPLPRDKDAKTKRAWLAIIFCAALLVVGIFVSKTNLLDDPGSVSVISGLQDTLARLNTRHVSPVSSQYLQQNKKNTLILEPLQESIVEDLSVSGTVEFALYKTEIDKLLSEIKKLETMAVKNHSPLKEYEDVCKVYYSYIHDYYANCTVKRSISSLEFTQYCQGLVVLETPSDALLRVFKEQNVYYCYTDDAIYYKISSSSTI